MRGHGLEVDQSVDTGRHVEDEGGGAADVRLADPEERSDQETAEGPRQGDRRRLQPEPQTGAAGNEPSASDLKTLALGT